MKTVLVPGLFRLLPGVWNVSEITFPHELWNLSIRVWVSGHRCLHMTSKVSEYSCEGTEKVNKWMLTWAIFAQYQKSFTRLYNYYFLIFLWIEYSGKSVDPTQLLSVLEKSRMGIYTQTTLNLCVNTVAISLFFLNRHVLRKRVKERHFIEEFLN